MGDEIIKINMNFKQKLLAVFFIVGIIPLLSLWIYETTFIISSTEENIKNYTESNIDMAAELIDNNLNTYKKMVGFIADNLEVQEIMARENHDYEEGYKFNDTQELYKITRAIMATQSIEIPLHIVNLDKKSRFSTTNYYSPIYSDERGDLYERLMRNEGEVITKIHRRVDGAQSKDTVMAIGKTITDKNTKEVIGFVITDIYDYYFDDIFNSISFIKDANVILVDEFGYIITDKTQKNSTGFRFESSFLNSVKDDKGSLDLAFDKTKFKCYYTTAKNTKIKVIQITPKSYFFTEGFKNMKFFITLSLIVAIISIILALKYSKKIAKPIGDMTSLMRKVENGHRDVCMECHCTDEIGELAHGFNDMIKEINRLIDEDFKKELLVQQAEFNALKSQVNPHFLYNALNSIKWMASLEENDAVIEATGALAKFFRYSVKNNVDTVSVKQEIDQINNYLIIQKYRYRDKFIINQEIDEGILNLEMLKLTLQPLVENAIVHGLEKKIGKGILKIKAYEEHDKVIFKIMDNGVGLDNSKNNGEGIGISNVDKRLKLYYGNDYGVTYKNEQGFTVFQVVIPKKESVPND